MVETPFTGLTASVSIGAGANKLRIGYISGFDLTLEKTMIEVLQFGSTYTEKVPAIKNWSASCDGTLAIATGGSQEQLYQAYEQGTPLTFTIQMDPRTYFQGTGYVASFNISGAPDDKLSLSAEIDGSGAVFLTLPTESVIADLMASTATANSVTLSWTPPTGISMQEIQYSTDQINWPLVTTEAALTATSTSAVALNLLPATTYYFRVRAIGGPNAGYSNVVSKATLS